MTGRVLPFDPSAHAAADALLPFFVNGTLRGKELAFVEEHVRACERCQVEVDWLREVFAACAAVEPAPETTPADLRRFARIERPTPAGISAARISHEWRKAQPWTRWVLAAQLAAIAVLGTLLATETRNEGAYRTLGAANGSAAVRDAIAVMFDPGVTESEIRRVVLVAGARIVDGPTSTNAYVLEVPAGQVDQAMQVLRAERAVRLAETLGPKRGR